ncbi:family 78 glycoside hydrolase catalytic domain [Sphingomonas sp. LR61]
MPPCWHSCSARAGPPVGSPGGGGGGWYADEPAGFAELRITFADGHEQLVATDTDWQALSSAITADQLYDGEDIDARLRDGSFLTPGEVTTPSVDGHEGRTSAVRTVDIGERELVADTVPPVRPLAEIAPVEVWTSPSGATLVDFGVNLVGWLRVVASGPAGTVLTLKHAEVLEHDELGTRPLRTAKATDHFTLSGGEDHFEPRFTFHGFRYAQVDGWTGTLDELRAAVTAVQVGSDLTRTGTFESSHELLNTFHDNVIRGMQGNFLSVPTDCPQRDERLGWTGDIAAFAPTASYLFDTRAFLGDWLRDVWLEQQHADGVIPFVVPDVLKYSPAEDFGTPDATAIWSDAGVWVPWTLYQAYGDTAVLEEQLDSMTAHLRRIKGHLSPEGLWDTVFQFGDWLDPDAPPEDAAKAKADPGVVATACAYRSATLVAQAARLTGHEAEATEAEELATGLQAAFRQHYVTDGRIRSDCTTVYALAIVFGILDEDDERRAGDRLAGAGRAVRVPDLDGLRGYAVHHRRADADRTPRRRVPAAAADGVPVVAVPGDDGCDDGLGALGLDAAGRHHQPGRDDLVQPLRTRCRGGLDAPGGGRPVGARTGVRLRAHRTAAGRWPDVGVDLARLRARAHRGAVGARRRRAARPCTGAGGRHRSRALAGCCGAAARRWLARAARAGCGPRGVARGADGGLVTVGARDA